MLSNGYRIFLLSAIDKFGDYGIVGLCIVEIFENKANIDSLLFCCRIVGKNMEFSFISFILETLQSENITQITAYYIPTSKNLPVKNFYEEAKVTKKAQEKMNFYYGKSLKRLNEVEGPKEVLSELGEFAVNMIVRTR
jgi:predicted enzyme involved in methoxymalonyl-ACP biosynthesis